LRYKHWAENGVTEKTDVEREVMKRNRRPLELLSLPSIVRSRTKPNSKKPPFDGQIAHYAMDTFIETETILDLLKKATPGQQSQISPRISFKLTSMER
jgi:hypothetical protein